MWHDVYRKNNTREGYRIRPICACPYDGFDTGWSREWKQQYRETLNACNPVRYISVGYSRSCFQLRTKWMEGHAAKVIAVFDEKKERTQKHHRLRGKGRRTHDPD